MILLVIFFPPENSLSVNRLRNCGRSPNQPLFAREAVSLFCRGNGFSGRFLDEPGGIFFFLEPRYLGSPPAAEANVPGPTGWSVYPGDGIKQNDYEHHERLNQSYHPDVRIGLLVSQSAYG